MNNTEKIQQREKRMRRLSPPGYDAEKDRQQMQTAFAIAAAFAVIWFALSLLNERDNIYISYPDTLVSNTYLTYNEVINGSLFLFWFPIIRCVMQAVNRLTYLTTDSRSIYTLRRLSSRGEVLLRVLAMPAICLAATFAAMILLIAVTWIIYCAAIPREVIPEDAFQQMLRQVWHWWLFTEPYLA